MSDRRTRRAPIRCTCVSTTAHPTGSSTRLQTTRSRRTCRCPTVSSARHFVRVKRLGKAPAAAVRAADYELGPIRVLVVVGDPTDTQVATNEELDGIHKGVRDLLGRVHLEVVYGPSRETLAELNNVT